MLAEVYFATRRASAGGGLMEKIEQLCEAAGLAQRVAAGDRVALKCHFGERGNTTHLRPEIVRRVVGRVLRLDARPYVTDTNARHSRWRQEAISHLAVAAEHGYTRETVGAPVLIADGLDGQLSVNLPGGALLGEVRAAEAIASADAVIVLNHVTLHPEVGLVGSLYQLAVGALCREAKLALPPAAVSVGSRGRSPESKLPRQLAEVVSALMARRPGKFLFCNVATEITPDPDGQGWSDAAVVPDVGLLVSADPVALDQATADLINGQDGLSGTRLADPTALDKIRAVHPAVDWGQLLAACEASRLGSRDYELLII